MEALRNPIAASATVIVAGAFMVALAAFLLVYQARPRFKAAFGTQETPERRQNTLAGSVLTVRRGSDALQTQIETEQSLTLGQQQLAPRTDLGALRRARERKDNAPPAGCGDAARVRQ